VIELTDIAYVRSGVADLDKAVSFATEIVGLELVAAAAELLASGAPVARSAQLRASRCWPRCGTRRGRPWLWRSVPQP